MMMRMTPLQMQRLLLPNLLLLQPKRTPLLVKLTLPLMARLIVIWTKLTIRSGAPTMDTIWMLMLMNIQLTRTIYIIELIATEDAKILIFMISSRISIEMVMVLSMILIQMTQAGRQIAKRMATSLSRTTMTARSKLVVIAASLKNNGPKGKANISETSIYLKRSKPTQRMPTRKSTKL